MGYNVQAVGYSVIRQFGVGVCRHMYTVSVEVGKAPMILIIRSDYKLKEIHL